MNAATAKELLASLAAALARKYLPGGSQDELLLTKSACESLEWIAEQDDVCEMAAQDVTEGQ